MQGRLDTAIQTIGDVVADVLKTAHIDEGQGEIGIAVQYSTSVRQEIFRLQQGADCQIRQGEGGTFIGDGARDGWGHLRQDEGAEGRPPNAVRTGLDQNGSRGDANAGLHVAQGRQRRCAIV